MLEFEARTYTEDACRTYPGQCSGSRVFADRKIGRFTNEESPLRDVDIDDAASGDKCRVGCKD
jgi:hypothetical protein